MFFTKANVVHMGDVFMDQGVSFGQRSDGSSMLELIDTLERVLPTIPADAKVVPGHGPIGTRQDVARGLETMKEMRDEIARGISAGKTRDQLVAEQVLAKFKDSLPWFDKDPKGYVIAFYRELSAETQPKPVK